MSKGRNFAITHKHNPKEKIVSVVETALDQIQQDTAEEIRQDVERILRKNQGLTILKADKRNAIVVMNTIGYKQKMMDILKDDCYKQMF